MMFTNLVHFVGLVVFILALSFGMLVLMHRYHNTIDVGMRTLSSFIERNFERLP